MTQQIKLIKDADRLSDEEIYDLISKIEIKYSRILDVATEEMLSDILGKRRHPLSITAYEPGIDTEFSGRVMQLNNPVNIFKKLGYDPNTPISVKLLGKMGSQKWAQMVVRSHPNMRNECYEYLIYIPLNYLKKFPIRQGDMVAGVLKVQAHLKGQIWVLQFHKAI